jgi:hypothetical protein
MMRLFIMFDFGLEVSSDAVSTLTMVLELATVLLGAFVGVVAVLYVAPKGYLGHPKKKGSTDSVTSVEVTPVESYAAQTEQAVGVPAAVATTAAEPAPSPVQAIYETVQPTPAPVQYAAPSTTSFGAPSISKKPTRTYRRRTAPVRSSAASKTSLKPKTKKR